MVRNLPAILGTAVFMTAAAHAAPLSLNCRAANGNGFPVYLDLDKQEARLMGLPVRLTVEKEQIGLSTTRETDKSGFTLVTIQRKDLAFEFWRMTSKPVAFTEYKGYCVKVTTQPGYQL